MSEIFLENRMINTDFVRIENRAQFLTTIPAYHPDDPRYTQYWSLQTKRAVEGMWGSMFGGWRYMRGPTYYYANFFVIQVTDRNKRTFYRKPDIDDLEWEISYNIGVARGFSGFANDTEETCLKAVYDYINDPLSGLTEEFIFETFPSAIKPDGTLKRYVDPHEYIRRIHQRPLGRALYENETENFLLAGSRGGGKSYIVAGECEHVLMFDGATAYDRQFIEELLTAEIAVGSAVSDKSSEFVSKIITSIEAKADPKISKEVGLGVYGDHGSSTGYFPSFFYRSFEGSVSPNNKQNPYRYEYRREENGTWVPSGTGTRMFHINYSPKKQDGAESASGGRYLVSVIEEVGLAENAEDINRSNRSTVSREGVRFGTEMYIGTSGNLLKAIALKRMMLSPQDYDIMAISNKYGTEGRDGKVAMFLPFYMTLRQYKDKDGNTDFNAAIAHVERLRKKTARSNDPEALRKEKMNRPCWIDEMWLSYDAFIMPYEELSRREKELLKFDTYKTLGTPIKLMWDSSVPNGVVYEIDHEGEPYIDWPINHSKRKKPTGCPVMFEPPQYINGAIPDDMYFFGHDPYVEEDFSGGGSIGTAYVILNPKYTGRGFSGNCIVASYNDKPMGGIDEYYTNLEKLLALYGNPTEGLMFEKNRGQDCRAHFIGKNKVKLLAPTPQAAQGTSIYQQNITSYGYTVGNAIVKSQLAKALASWLLEESELNYDGIKRNVERVPCLFLIRQLLSYNLKDNFDAADGMRGCIVKLNEYRTLMASSERHREQREHSTLSYYRNNSKIFKRRSYGERPI